MSNASEVLPTHFMGCAQIYHLRWYVRSPRGLADGIAHKSRGQKGKLPFPFGAENAPTL